MISALRPTRFPLFLLLGAIAFGLMLPPAIEAAPGRWSIPFGKEPGQVGFENASTTPAFEEPAPLGPLSFRVHGDSLWVADSLNGRILGFGPDGKLRQTVLVPGVASNTLLEDFAIVPAADGAVESLWVADGADLIVRKIAVADGRELARLGGPLSVSGVIDEPGRFAQIHQVECGPEGRVYIGDYGRAVVAIFDGSGKLLREIPWLRTGFVVLPGERLSFPVWSEQSGWSLKTWNADGALIESIALGAAVGQNPRLWSRTAEGGVLTCIPQGGFRGFLHLVELGPRGQFLRRQLLKPIPGMNRFFDPASGSPYRVRTDYDAAPKGAFEVLALAVEADTSGATASESEALAVPASAPVSAIQIVREKVATLPALEPDQTIGMRVSRSLALVAARDGRLFKIDLVGGAVTQETFGTPLLDFALVGSAVIGLATDGSLVGALPETWTKTGFSACRIDTAGAEGLLTGGGKARYLSAPPATQTVDLDEPPQVIPFRDGLLWAMRRQASGRVWSAELMDMFGNRMKRIYRFAPEFDPAGLTLEPVSPEGELFISFWTGTQREVALIGQNGRMFWRLPVSDPVCPRDLGWDHEGRLLMLEKDGAGLALQRLKFSQPEG